jgi:hypothetical protein
MGNAGRNEAKLERERMEEQRSNVATGALWRGGREWRKLI